MAIDLTTFRALYPEFAAVSDVVVTSELEGAQLLFDDTALGKFYERIVYLYAAHRLALQYNISAACGQLGKSDPYSPGQAASISASNSSLSQSSALGAFAVGDNPWMVDMARTTYGLELLSILRIILPVGRVVY